MADNNRDVELVIRAKNEASKALDAVSSALDQLTKAQSGVSQTSGKTTSLLAQFGAELGKLSQTVAGMSTFDRMTSSVNKAAAGVARLEESVTQLTAEQGRLTAEVSKSEAAVNRYKSQSAQLSAQLEQQKAATLTAKAGLTELNKEIGSGDSELKRRISSDRQFEASLLRQETALTRTQQRHRDLTQALLAADAPSATLIASFTKIDLALADQTAKLSSTRAAYAQNRTAIADLGTSLATLRQQQEAATASLAQAKSAQANTANTLKTTGIAARETAKALTDIRAASDGNVAATTRQTEALAKSRVELAQVQGVAQQAGASLERIGGVVRQGLLRALADSQIALAKYRAEWAATTAAISTGMKAQAPGASMTPELTALIEKARLSKAAVIEMQLAITQMRTAVREAGTDVVKLAGAEQTFSAALERVKVAADASAAAQARVNAATAGTASSAGSASSSMSNLAAATQRQGAAAAQAGDAMAQLEGRGRQALSWAQRLRGEVVALATAYVGVFAAIQQLGGVVSTYQTIEAAQSRLRVAFDGNEAVVGREFRFIRAEADRLGISIGTLANEYSKFAIATKGSSLEGEQTRKIFTAVSEAARVNKLSIDQIQGTYLALTQMVSKGNVSMEELRQQLGERLYGAFTLAGKAMNLTGAELSKLIATGQLASEEFLPKFADELNKTFGPQLPKSLQSLTTELGQFQNEIFKAQENVANGGFVEGLRVGLKGLTEFFRSEEGKQFFQNLGAAAGGLIKILAEIPRYATPITTIFSVWAGLKVLNFVTNLSSGFQKTLDSLKPLPSAMNAATSSFNAFAAVGGTYTKTAAAAVPLTQRMTAAFNAMTIGLRTSTGAMTAASIGAGVLSRALTVLRGVMATLGGLPGLIVTGLSIAFSLWMTGTEKATNAVEAHKQQVLALLDAYGQAKDKAGDWAKAVQGVTLAGLMKTASDLRTGLEAATKEVTSGISGKIESSLALNGSGRAKGLGLQAGIKQLDEMELRVIALGKSLKAGDITISDYSKALNDMLKDPAATDRLKKLITDNGKLLETAVETERAVAENGVAIQAMGGNAGAAQPLIEKLGISLAQMAGAAGVATETKLVDPMVALAKQVDILKGKIPSLKDELKKLEDLKELDEILKTVNLIEGLDKSSAKYKEFLALVQKGQNDINNAFNEKQFKEITNLLTGSGSGVDMSSKLLKQFEGFQGTAKWDVNAFRAGFGSDTVTLDDGSVRKVVEGMKVSVEDANRDLVRRIGEFQNTIKGQIGGERFNSFNPQQQAALTSVAYNYGSLPERILGAVKTGTSEEIATAIRALGTDNNGVNANRRGQEAAIFQQGPNFNPEGMAKVYEQELQTAKQFHETLAGNLEIKKQEAEADKRRTLDQQLSLAITKAENDAKKAGTELTAAERALITANVTEAQKKKEAEWAVVDAKKAQVEGEQKIATLQQLRRDLLEQMKFAQQQGDQVGYDQLKLQLNDVTAQLDVAINKMIEFWNASGNPEKAAAAIASLQNVKNSLITVGQQGILTAQNVGKVFGSSVLNFANNFLDKIRETGDVIGSLKDAFRQFASDFLLQIAKMIAQQAILNALKMAFGGATGMMGSIGQGVIAAVGGVAHEGGVVGQSIGSRPVNPTWFRNAAKYHTGGVAGLKSNEVPTILEKGEVIRTADQERALAEQQAAGAGAPVDQSVKIVNAIDAGSFVSAGVEDVQGQRAILNFMRANQSAVRSALGV